MKKNQTLLFSIFITLFNFNGFSQISIGSIERIEEVKKNTEVPPYDGSELFLPYTAFYGDRQNDDNPTEENYYKRYNGFQIYYPIYTDNDKENRAFILKKSDYTLLKWKDMAEKYYTIEKIHPVFEKTDIYSQINDNDKENYKEDILLEIKDKKTGEYFYITEDANSYTYHIKFIVVAYYENLKKLIESNTFIATSNFYAQKVPLRKDNSSADLEEGTKWKGELKILRKEDMSFFNSKNQDIVYAVILNNKIDTVLMDYHNKNDYKWYFKDVLTTESNDKKTQNTKKQDLDKLIKKYGSKYGNLVYQKKLDIGMTKEMCVESWGITLNKTKRTEKTGEIEVWEYTDVAKLHFTNGKLSKIVKY